MAKKAPKLYLQLQKQHGEVFDAVEALGKATRGAGPLDDRTAHLVQLAAAAAIRSEGAVHSHVRRAVAAGAGRNEIHHTLVLLVSTIGFPNVVAALSWAEDVLGKK